LETLPWNNFPSHNLSVSHSCHIRNHTELEEGQIETIDPEEDQEPTFGNSGGNPPYPPDSKNISCSDSSDSSSSDSESKNNMANKNNLFRDVDQPWLAQDVVAVPGLVHPLPKNLEKFLPIFNPDEKQSAEDLVCRLLPYTFVGKASTWYFSLPQGSIGSWNDFQTTFLSKFGEDKTPAALVLELSRIKMNPKEKIKEFNQRFLTLRNKIPTTTRLAEEVTLEFYT